MDLPDARYRTVVIDPPWPLRKTGARKSRPNQVGHGDLGYSMMSLDEIKSMDILSVTEEDAFVFLWTTQRFLRDAFDILDGWGFRYRFTMVWHKPTGAKPFNHPISNAEFILVGVSGSPKFVSEKQFFAVLNAKASGHSVKPEAFYELLRRVCPGPRLDMFARRHIDGFDAWGDQVPEDTPMVRMF